MIITLTEAITNDTKHLELPENFPLIEASFADVINEFKDEFDPEYNYRFYVNGEELPLEDMDLFVEPEDHLAIVKLPAGFIAGLPWLVKALIGMALSMAINWVAMKLFAPKEPETYDYTSDPVYSLNNGQNSARLGNYIPVHYGTVKMYPDYISRPRITYDDESEQYLHQLMAIGQGEYEVHKILIGNQDISGETGVEYKVFRLQAGDSFIKKIGDPSYTTDVSKQIEAVSNEPSKVKDEAPIHTIHPEVKKIQMNFIARGGIWVADSKTGKRTARGVDMRIEFYDDKGNLISGKDMTVSSLKTVQPIPGTKYPLNSKAKKFIQYMCFTGAHDGAEIRIKRTKDGATKTFKNTWGKAKEIEKFVYDNQYDKIYMDTAWKDSLTTSIATKTQPVGNTIRRTFYADVPKGTVSFTVFRKTPESDSTTVNDKVDIEAVYELYDPNTNIVENVTFVYTKLQATGNVSGGNKLAMMVKRLDKGNLLPDVLKDIYSNQQYGAKLPATDLVFDSEAQYIKLNVSYSKEITVLDAFNQTANPHMFHIIPRNDKLYIKKDKPQSIPIQKYSEINMTKVNTSFFFDDKDQLEDGIKGEYLNADFDLEDVSYPTNAVRGKVVKLFGISDRQKATAYVKYLYKQEKARRKMVKFRTDIQGRIPELLDLIEVTHPAVNSSKKPELFQITNIKGDQEDMTIEAVNYDPGIFS